MRRPVRFVTARFELVAPREAVVAERLIAFGLLTIARLALARFTLT